MKFDDLYPDQPFELLQEDIQSGGSYLFKYGDPIPCWHCGDLTQWIDMSFEAHLCSEECVEAKWEQFRFAYNKTYEEDKKRMELLEYIIAAVLLFIVSAAGSYLVELYQVPPSLSYMAGAAISMTAIITLFGYAYWRSKND